MAMKRQMAIQNKNGIIGTDDKITIANKLLYAFNPRPLNGELFEIYKKTSHRCAWSETQHVHDIFLKKEKYHIRLIYNPFKKEYVYVSINHTTKHDLNRSWPKNDCELTLRNTLFESGEYKNQIPIYESEVLELIEIDWKKQAIKDGVKKTDIFALYKMGIAEKLIKEILKGYLKSDDVVTENFNRKFKVIADDIDEKTLKMRERVRMISYKAL